MRLNTYLKKRAVGVGLVVFQTKQLITPLKTWLHSSTKHNRNRSKPLLKTNKTNMTKRWTRLDDLNSRPSLKMLITVKCKRLFQEVGQINIINN
jgi:hypothetical protein